MTPEPVESVTRIMPSPRAVTPVEFGVWPPARQSYNHISGGFVRGQGTYADLHARAWYLAIPGWDPRNSRRVSRVLRGLEDTDGSNRNDTTRLEQATLLVRQILQASADRIATPALLDITTKINGIEKRVETSQADWVAGTVGSGLDAATTPGELKLAIAGPDIIESFEEADLSAWTKTGGTWTLKTDQVYNGSKSISGSSGSTDTASNTGTNIWDVLYKGSLGRPSSVAGRFRYTDNTKYANYGVALLAGAGGAYMVRYDASYNGGYFDLGKWAAGSETILASITGKAVNLNAWFKISLAVDQSGNLTAKLYQTDGTLLATLTATDNTITSGGYGIVVAQGDSTAAGGDPNARVDYLEADTNPSDYTASGQRSSPALEYEAPAPAAGAVLNVSWTASTPSGTAITVEASVDAGATWHTVANGVDLTIG